MNAAIDLETRRPVEPSHESTSRARGNTPNLDPGEKSAPQTERRYIDQGLDAPAVTNEKIEANAKASAKALRAHSKKGTILRYKADRRSVTYTLAALSLHFLVFFTAPIWVAAVCIVPLVLVSVLVSPINHHHQHFNTFHSRWLNRIYEIALSLQTGISPYGWVLHHNLGHHRNYLNQRPHPEHDESKWTRKDGSQMGEIEYTIDLVLNHQIDIFRVGRRYPRFLRAYLLMKIPLWSIVGALLYLNLANALLVFIIPGFIALVHTSWVTYGHHAGNYPTSHYDASMNQTHPWFNYMTCNLGYHTAHHKRPGVHWSLLPEIHEEIKDQIPPEMITTSFW